MPQFFSKNTLLCALSLSCTSMGFAATQPTAPTIENFNKVTQTNVDGALQPKTALHGVKKGFIVDGSLLYWKAEVDNLEYAVHSYAKFNNPASHIKQDSRVNELDFEWGAGGRLGIGYVFNQMEGWKLTLTGTHLETDAHGSTKVKSTNIEQESLVPSWSSFTMGEYLTKASGEWELDFNTLNLDLSRDFFVSKYLSMSPFVGLQGAWIGQKFEVEYEGNWVVNHVPDNLIFSKENSLDMHNHFRGGGLHFGTDFIFHFIKNFGVTGTLSGSVIYGFNNNSTETDGAFPISTGIAANPARLLTIDATEKEKKHRIRTSLETELGFIWEQYWSQDTKRFALSATYAFSVWFDQNFFINPGDVPNEANLNPTYLQGANYAYYAKPYGDLEMQGLVVKAEFDF